MNSNLLFYSSPQGREICEAMTAAKVPLTYAHTHTHIYIYTYTYTYTGGLIRHNPAPRFKQNRILVSDPLIYIQSCSLGVRSYFRSHVKCNAKKCTSLSFCSKRKNMPVSRGTLALRPAPIRYLFCRFLASMCVQTLSLSSRFYVFLCLFLSSRTSFGICLFASVPLRAQYSRGLKASTQSVLEITGMEAVRRSTLFDSWGVVDSCSCFLSLSYIHVLTR